MTAKLSDANASSQPGEIVLGRAGRLFSLECRLVVPRPVAEVFDFFSDAGNLQAITPDWLDFSILTPRPIAMGAGAVIDYLLRVRGFPIRWRTEIPVWEPPHRFVDEQRRGPYRVWIHEHRFRARADGTEVVDFVKYLPPGGWLADRLFVRRDVETIFRHRQAKLREIFGR
jgi:ligand-binding SRPBCC domain-containing protein